MKKKIVLFLLAFVISICAISAEEIKETKSSIYRETTDVDKTHYVEVKLYKNFNQAIFTVVNHNTIEYDEGFMEKTFFEFIENWIRDNNHRYYYYTVVHRKMFYSRPDNNGKKTYQIEYRVNLSK
jgi:hypothetical protein